MYTISSIKAQNELREYNEAWRKVDILEEKISNFLTAKPIRIKVKKAFTFLVRLTLTFK